MSATKDKLDFIVIGAQKSGTSSLFQYLRQHPEIFIPGDKEAAYFCHDAAVATVDWSAYMDKVASNVPGARGTQLADPALRWGTVTPMYMLGTTTSEDPERSSSDERTVPRRMLERIPEVRLISILRDPVERAVSAHRMLVSRGLERRPFDEAIDELLRPEALERSRKFPQPHTSYVVRGEYGRILSGFFEVFPREQILVVFTEELEREPAQLLRRVHAFIGVGADFQPDNIGAAYNVGKPQRGFRWNSPPTWLSPSSPVSPQGIRRAVRANSAARAAWRRLPRERRRRLSGPYERVAARMARWNRNRPANEVPASAEPSAATLARLREHYAEDGRRLSALAHAPAPWLASTDAELAPR